MLIMYERGGRFITEHGFVDIAGAGFCIAQWADYIETPSLSLDRSTLDNFDI